MISQDKLEILLSQVAQLQLAQVCLAEAFEKHRAGRPVGVAESAVAAEMAAVHRAKKAVRQTLEDAAPNSGPVIRIILSAAFEAAWQWPSLLEPHA